MSGISTHVLDTAAGKPAAGIPVHLFQNNQQLGSGVTDQNGRCATLLPEDVQLEAGVYRIVFDVNAIYPNSFYPSIEISFHVAHASEHYHVPLLLSPFGFTTYRGS
jgi:5-hydroxyisourate hydrolase